MKIGGKKSSKNTCSSHNFALKRKNRAIQNEICKTTTRKYLGLEQFHSYSSNTITWPKSKNRNRNVCKGIDNRCKYKLYEAKYCLYEKFSIYLLRIIPRSSVKFLEDLSYIYIYIQVHFILLY